MANECDYAELLVELRETRKKLASAQEKYDKLLSMMEGSAKPLADRIKELTEENKLLKEVLREENILVPNKETQEAIKDARAGKVDPWFGVCPSIVVPDPQDAPYDHT